MDQELCDYFNDCMSELLKIKKDHPINTLIGFTTNYLESDKNLINYPNVQPTKRYQRVVDSNFVSRVPNCSNNCTKGNVQMETENLNEVIFSAINLDWRQQPKNSYDDLSFREFSGLTQFEFRKWFLFLTLKSEKFPNDPLSPKTADMLMEKYLNLLAFTRHLYAEFVEHKTYVRNQKKHRRDNYKRNVRSRLNIQDE